MSRRASAYFYVWVFPFMLLVWDAVQIARAGAANADGAESFTWPTAPGTITASEVGSIATGGRDHHDYIADISYSYAVDGHSYVGHRVRFVAFDGKKLEEARAIVARYPVSAAVTVHYESISPANAVLEPGQPDTRWQRKALGVAGVAAGIGVVLTLIVAVSRRKRRARA